MSHFFIDRPIFAWVIALVIMLAGVLSITRLPIAQYPSIAPPTITINATYPGASAKTLEDTVTQIIEQRMTGLDGLRYIASTSDSAGTATITLTFDAAVNPDIAQVQVQNKLKLAESQLPQEVQQQGVTVTKSVRNFIMVIGFVSDDPSMTRTDIADYVAANVLDPLSRVPGVGELTLFGVPVRDAHLARSEQADQLQAHARRRGGRDTRPERADRGRPARRLARGTGPATERHDFGAGPTADAGAVRGHRPAHRTVGRDGSPARRRTRRTRRRELQHGFASTTANRLPVWPYVSPPVRTRCRRPMRSRPRSRSWSASSRRG